VVTPPGWRGPRSLLKKVAWRRRFAGLVFDYLG
jgi:hypothetical protein